MQMSYDGCFAGYESLSENIHYYYQFAYFFPAICLNYRILFVIWVSQRHFYSNNSFYNLYSIDCTVSILAMSVELVFTRLFLYFPQFCVLLSGIVRESPIFMRIYYCGVNYFKAIKPVIHIFVAVNRMSCVMFPITYSQNWSAKMRIMVIVILLSPFLVIWNTLISRNHLAYLNGGFGITYERRVSWASLSLMQFTLIILTVLITMVTTTVTFCKMTNMKKRIKSSEKALCVAAGLISVGFLLEAATESFFAFFKDAPWLINVMSYIMTTTWDILLVGSPLVLLLVSNQFRAHVLGVRPGRTQRVSSIQNGLQIHHAHHTVTRYVEALKSFPNMLATTPSFENYTSSCSENPNTVFFNRIYFLNAIYLVPTLALNIWIFIILRIRHAQMYNNNLTFWIITVETVVAIIHIVLDLSVVRLFLYFPQFCPQFSRYFINYPFINDIIFPLYNYCRVSKTVTQSAIILSRLICVQVPMENDKVSMKFTPLFISTTTFLPLLVILNTIISKKQVVFWYGGFFTIYHRKFVWVSLSSLHLTFLFLAISLFIYCSLMICRHLTPQQSVAKRNLTIHACFAVFGFVLQGFFQSYYALFRFRDWFPDFVIHGQFVIYDVMTVGCPIITVISSTELRSQLFSCLETSSANPTNYTEIGLLCSRKKTKTPENFDPIQE